MIIQWSPRNIELRSPAKDCIEKIERDGPPMYYEAYRGLSWLLARSPEIGLPHLDKYLYVQESDENAKTPSIYTLYDYTDERLFFYVIIFALPSNNLRNCMP